MPTVETAGRWAHVVTVDYYSENCEPPSKHSMQVFLKPRVEQRDAAIRSAELARVVKRLRDEAQLEKQINPGSMMADWTNRCADLLEREGAGA